jgi:nitrogen-specific signal transduction histidine kinase/DNA-binding response OmpR family regulator
MKTLLVVAADRSSADAIRASTTRDRYHVIHVENVTEAEPLLLRGGVDLALLDVELTDVRAIRLIENFKRVAPGCPVFILAREKEWEWEEDAYLQGVSRILTKPVRAELLNSFLDRELDDSRRVTEVSTPIPEEQPAFPGLPRGPLESLRDFSKVLIHSLNTSELLRQFLLKLRETIGVNRAVIFLRRPGGLMSLRETEQSLRPACAIGVEQGIVEHLALSLNQGIGGHLRREGRVLRADSNDARTDREISKEFQLIGARVAIPILDRQTLIGVALFDRRITGESYSSDELALVFHTLEELGLAIKNSWVHDQLLANHTMVADILGQLGSGCVVISEDMDILHANSAARHYLQRDSKKELEFADLPQELGSKVYSVLKAGRSMPPAKLKLPGQPETSFQVSVAPFQSQDATNTRAALLIIEDVTQQERSQRLEIEASELRLLRTMAERLAHEINNALTPIATHQQLLTQKFGDPEFRRSFSDALADSVRRITRFTDQVVALAHEGGENKQRVPVAQLLTEAFREAHTHHHGKLAQLDFNASEHQWNVRGNYKSLCHAFSEILLNALQANPSDPHVAVRIDTPHPRNGNKELKIDVTDSGGGFSKEAVVHATEPFFTTRNVGVGLGLTVARKILENHRGRIEIPGNGQRGLVRVWLPLEQEAE